MTDETTTATATKKPRRRRARGSLEIEALADFVRALEQIDATAQRAAINWLSDRYLKTPRKD